MRALAHIGLEHPKTPGLIEAMAAAKKLPESHNEIRVIADTFFRKLDKLKKS